MEIYLDSSNLDEVNRWAPIISGVTTNPSILKKEGNTLDKLCELVEPKPVSIEACGDFITDARKYKDLYKNAVIKIPLLKPDSGDNLVLIKKLEEEGIRVNCTALFSLSQVVLATLAGASYVSLFAGRVDDEGGDPPGMIADCMNFLDCQDKTKLIIGSVRTVGNVLDAIKSGADIITIPPPILAKMIEHKYSRVTVQQFEEDSKLIK